MENTAKRALGPHQWPLKQVFTVVTQIAMEIEHSGSKPLTPEQQAISLNTGEVARKAAKEGSPPQM